MSTAERMYHLEPAGEWLEHRSCSGVHPDVFFIGVGGSSTAAKALCAGCPVRQECLDYALDNHEDHGIWGGLTEKERRPLARGHRRPLVAPCGTDAGYYRHLRVVKEPACEQCLEAHRSRQRLYNRNRAAS